MMGVRDMGLGMKVALVVLAGTGLLGVAPVTFAELSTGNACPGLGPVPACHVVTIAYGAMLASVLFGRGWLPYLFFLGWIPVFLLAAGGSALEVLGQGICPKTESGWPKCFFSLALALTLLVPLLIHWVGNRRRQGLDQGPE